MSSSSKPSQTCLVVSLNAPLAPCDLVPLLPQRSVVSNKVGAPPGLRVCKGSRKVKRSCVGLRLRIKPASSPAAGLFENKVCLSHLYLFIEYMRRCIFKVFCKYNINIINIFISIVWISEHQVFFKVQKYFKSLTLVSLFFTNVLLMFVRTDSSLYIIFSMKWLKMQCLFLPVKN